MLNYLSVCSGIEAASVAWHPLGWRAIGYSEIEKFPAAVLAHHYPTVPNLGDFTAINTHTLPRTDILVGGTPCQSFSLAGLRSSLDDARGNLTLAFVRLAHDLAANNGLRNALWENVPGVLSTKDNAFGCFLGGLVGADSAILCDGRWPSAGMVAGPKGRAAWRILDAQYFGLAQRRKRVFVVADFGNGADPAAVLFERQSVHGNFAPRREARERIADSLTVGANQYSGFCGEPVEAADDVGCLAVGNTVGSNQFMQSKQFVVHAPDLARCVTTREGSSQDYESTSMIAHTLRGVGHDASEDGTGRGVPLVAFSMKDHGGDAANDLSPTLRAADHSKSHANSGAPPAVAFDLRGREGGANLENIGDTAALRAASGGSNRSYVASSAVRRLTPMECERLQGFPDGYTAINRKGVASDGPRYKALGNSMAVPVMRWIGVRIAKHMPIIAANDNHREQQYANAA